MELFLESGLTYAVLQILGNQLNLTERLKSWDVGLAKILAVSFTNVLDKLLMPVALNRYKPFAILPFWDLIPRFVIKVIITNISANASHTSKFAYSLKTVCKLISYIHTRWSWKNNSKKLLWVFFRKNNGQNPLKEKFSSKRNTNKKNKRNKQKKSKKLTNNKKIIRKMHPYW